MKNMKNVPLIRQEYIYVGRDTEFHKKGETYYVVETGYHWVKEYGFVIWVATKENRNLNDLDLCWSMSVDYFNGNFWKP